MNNQTPLALIFGVSLIGMIVLAERMPIALVPSLESPSIDILNAWTGASPELLESRVVAPQERLLRQIPGIVSMESRVFFGRSITTIRFDPKEELSVKYLYVLQVLSQVRNHPEAALSPEVVVGGRDPAKVVASLLITKLDGSGPSLEAQEYVEYQVIPELMKIPGIELVEFIDLRRPELRVTLHDAKITNIGIEFENIIKTLDSLRSRTSAQVISSEGMLESLTFEPIPTVDDFRQVPLSSIDGVDLRLSDIGDATSGLEPSHSLVMFNMTPALYFRVIKDSDASALSVLANLSTKIRDINKSLSKNGMRLEMSFDSSSYINSALIAAITALGITILTLAALVIGAFKRWMVFALVATGLSFSLCGGLLLLSMFQYSLNLVTIAGLIIGAGLALDASIIMVQGLTGTRSDVERSKAVAILRPPIVISTMTTLVVFTPLLFIGGPLEVVFGSLAIGITGMITASAIWALFIIPNIWPDVDLKRVLYDVSLKRFLPKQRSVCLAIGVAIPIFGLVTVVASFRTPELLPQVQSNNVYLYLTFPEIPSLDRLNSEIVPKIRRELGAVKSEKNNENEDALFATDIFFHEESSGTALVLQCKTPKYLNECVATAEQLRTRLVELEEINGAYLRPASLLTFGEPEDRSIRLFLFHDDYDLARNKSEQIKSLIDNNIGYATTLTPSTSAHWMTSRVTPRDTNWGNLSSMNRQDVSNYLRALSETGLNLGEIYIGQREYQLVVHVAVEEHQPTPIENRIRKAATNSLSGLVDVNPLKQSKELFRRETKRVVLLEVFPSREQSLYSLRTVLKELVEDTAPEISAEIEVNSGTNADINENLVKILIVALLALVGCIAFYFRNMWSTLTALSVYPICVSFGLLATYYYADSQAYATDLLSIIGLLILVGLISNNSILFVDAYNRSQDIDKALKERFTGLLLASITSIVGAATLAFIPTESSIVYRGLGYGICFGMVLGLPISYYCVGSLLQSSSPSARSLA